MSRRQAHEVRCNNQFLSHLFMWHVKDNNLMFNDTVRAPLRDLERSRLRRYDLPLTWKPDWRRVYPNLVVHPLFGDALTIATDGVHVTIDPGDGHLVEVSKQSLVGPILPFRVSPADWDWERNKRCVRVFRRKAPKPPVIIPTNVELDEYFEGRVPSRMSRSDFHAYAALARGANPADFEKILAALEAGAATRKPQARLSATTRRTVLDTL